MSPRPAEQPVPSSTKPRYGLRSFVVGLLGAGLVVACLPWPVSSPRIVAMVADELAKSYGIALTVEGATEIALLPFPRIRFAQARLASGAPDGPVLAEGGALSLHLDLLALITGRVGLDALSLDGAAVTLPMTATDRRWASPAQSLSKRVGSDRQGQFPRLSLTRATVTGWNPRVGAVQTLQDVDLSLSAPLLGTSAEIVARGTWRQQEASLRVTGLDLAALVGDAASSFAATLAWPAGSLSLKGSGRLGEIHDVSGRARLATRSLPETLRWLDGDVALSPLMQDVAVEGDFRVQGKDLLLPQMRITVGSNRLEGAGSVSFADGRPAIQATLAAESLNIAPLVGELIGALGLDPDASQAPVWKKQTLALGPFTGGDLDLRISAASARIGPVLVEDIASSLIVRHGSIEASLGRASLQGGTVKGRVIFGELPHRGGTEVRAQGAFDGLDLGALLIDVGEYRWLVGAVNGTFAMESRASTMGELVGRIGGRAAVAVERGTITGLDLADVMQRDGAVAPPVQRMGRTDFAKAGFVLRFKDGLGTITEGTLAAPALTASLIGLVSLAERRFDARAELTPSGSGRPARLFEIVGPWNAIAVRALADRATESDPSGLAIMRPDMRRAPANVGVPAAARAYVP